MQTSKFLARLIGPLFLAMGLSLLVNGDALRVLVEQFLQSYALIYLAGLLALVAGLAIVNTHNIWTNDWRVVITIFGWLALIGGAFRMIFPQATAAAGMAIFSLGALPLVAGIGMLILGAWLTFMGYATVKIRYEPDKKTPPAKRGSKQ